MEIISPNENQTNVENINSQNTKQANNNLVFKIANYVKTAIFELLLVSLFSLIMLVALNYFNLIPLVSVFPDLSFLPQQNSTQKIINTQNQIALQDDVTFFNNNVQNLASCNLPKNDTNILLNQLITCDKPLKIINTKKNTLYEYVPGIDQPDAISDKGIEINFAIKADPNGKDDLGLLFGGGPTENRIYIAYYPSENAWGTQFLIGTDSGTFTPAYYPGNSSVSQRAYFSLRISKDGKNFSLLYPNGYLETFVKDKSFYTKDGTLSITAIVPTNSAITIYNLNYYTPQ